jgi:hypothetical protein
MNVRSKSITGPELTAQPFMRNPGIAGIARGQKIDYPFASQNRGSGHQEGLGFAVDPRTSGVVRYRTDCSAELT